MNLHIHPHRRSTRRPSVLLGLAAATLTALTACGASPTGGDTPPPVQGEPVQQREATSPEPCRMSADAAERWSSAGGGRPPCSRRASTEGSFGDEHRAPR